MSKDAISLEEDAHDDPIISLSPRPQGVVDTLNDKGHEVEVVGPWGVRNGFAPMLVNPETGVSHGGADPRKESVMLGW